ncbi:glycoside hydrolase family 104 protein [Lysobacter sp. LF1]|uniref:Glycoside hydrolase family 104 protein n=1 Tax=Lysobacter stagni TaxID=3045172 RepID=A0ABT6XL01_9GAMM|nr:glycoside hydrolase family 104 protein [Lysobacter sp. LF1]MDI9240754.1 glycoside hydrolase family 104 protein [Lysobacter sp. LF1]
MPRITAAQIGAGGANVCAFLDMLAFSEGTAGRGEDGYNVLVGGSLFSSYHAHPERSVWLPRYQVHSTAAGRYQFLRRTWRGLAQQLKLSDFGPESQDLGAVELIRGRKALEDLRAGRFASAIEKCAPEWASLPGAGYGQREHKLESLLRVYLAAGGYSKGK